MLVGLFSFALYGKVVTMLPRYVSAVEQAGPGGTPTATGDHIYHTLAPVELAPNLEGQR